MKIKDIMEFAVKEGIAQDPRGIKDIEKILRKKKEGYEKLSGIEKEIFDIHSFESPYADSRIIWGSPERDANEIWVGIDVDTPELLLVKKITENSEKKPLIIAHHPIGRAYSNFYEVMDMQADIFTELGVPASISDSITQKRKSEVSRKVSPANHFRESDAAKILDIPVLTIHTPADNHVKKYLDDFFEKEKPDNLKEAVNLLMKIPEYKLSAVNGQPPRILNGSESNRCGKIFVDMTGGTEPAAELLKALVRSGISTVVAMHMSDKHYEKAKSANLNVIIAGHISSDNLGLNLLIDKMLKKLGQIDIVDFAGFERIIRD